MAGKICSFHRHLKNKKAANELLTKLKDNRELQHFLQDGQEVKEFLWPLREKQNNSVALVFFFFPQVIQI